MSASVYPSVSAELAAIRERIARDEAEYERDYPPASPERLAWAESIIARCFSPIVPSRYAR